MWPCPGSAHLQQGGGSGVRWSIRSDTFTSSILTADTVFIYYLLFFLPGTPCGLWGEDVEPNTAQVVSKGA